MTQEALGALTAGLTDSPTTTQGVATCSESRTESTFAEILADVVRVERVSVDSNFFDDLGADSMVMAQFCARVRTRPGRASRWVEDGSLIPWYRSRGASAARVWSAGLCCAVRAGVGRQQLVRRPGRRLDGDGPVLRPGQKAARTGIAVGRGRVPNPLVPEPGRERRSCLECWLVLCGSSGCRPTATCSTTWAPTRW